MKKYAVKLIVSSDTVLDGLVSSQKIVYPYAPIEITSDEQFRQLELEFLSKHPSGMMILCDEESVKFNGFDDIISYQVPSGENLLCDTSSNINVITEDILNDS